MGLGWLEAITLGATETCDRDTDIFQKAVEKRWLLSQLIMMVRDCEEAVPELQTASSGHDPKQTAGPAE